MQLTELFEAKYSGANVGSAMSKIVSYLERAMGFKLLKLGVETFHNSAENARGIRYVEVGTLNCIRFNWVGSKSSEIVSIDLWNGTSRDPNFHIKLNGTSLVKALPALVQVLKAPKIGKVTASAVAEALMLEVKKGEYTETSAVNDMVQKLEAGRSFNRSEFINAYHVDNAHAYDEFVDANRDNLVFNGKRISIAKGTKLGAKADGDGGSLTVTKGGSGEEYEVDVPDVDRVTFSDSIKDLEGLTTAVIRGNANALFVAGRGGTGKTQTVEDVLAAHGLEDTKGYEKITGSASPIGIYYALYKNRTGIILFDDCDGALDQQDGRNVIKAATDTKKIRKIAWGKKNPGMYDPDTRAPAPTDPDDEDDGLDDEDELGGDDGKQDDKIPNRFNFEGRIIFISNMSLNKLDPDGALRTRAFVISVDPTPEEMFERMGEILHSIRLESGSLSSKEREEVLTVVRGSKRAKDASLRTLVRALNLASSGAPNWKLLVQRYA